MTPRWKAVLFAVITTWSVAIIVIFFRNGHVEILQTQSLSDDDSIPRETFTQHIHIHEHEMTMDRYPFLLPSMVNQISGETVTCNPLKYKYFRLLLAELESYFKILNQTRVRHSTDDIDENMLEWCINTNGNQFNRRQRIQIMNNTLYVSNHRYYKYGVDQEGYTTSVLLYLKSLMRKYSASIEDTDFVWHYHDVKLRRYYFKRYNWKLNGSVPYFFTDANVVWNDNDDITNILFGVSRDYMKFMHFGDTAFDKEWAKDQKKYLGRRSKPGTLLQSENFLRIADYLEFKNLIASHTAEEIEQATDWQTKPYNKALFVGGDAGQIRPYFFQALLNDSYIGDLTRDYFNVSHMTAGLSIEEQLKHKYVVVLDGTSVRDGFLYQLQFGSVLFKQRSTYYEWWLCDLVNHKHVIFFDNILHLIAIVTNCVDQVHGYYVNSKVNGEPDTPQQFRYLSRHDIVHPSEFNSVHLQQIAKNAKQFANDYLDEQSVDCYMINMLRVYNHYLFDTRSMHRSSLSTCPMTELKLDD